MAQSTWSPPWIVKIGPEETGVEYVTKTQFHQHAESTKRQFADLEARLVTEDRVRQIIKEELEQSTLGFVTTNTFDRTVGELKEAYRALEAKIPDENRFRAIVQEEVRRAIHVYLRPIWIYIGWIIIVLFGWGKLRLYRLFQGRNITTNAQFRRKSARALAQELRTAAPADWIEADLVPTETWIKEMQAEAAEEGEADASG